MMFFSRLARAEIIASLIASASWDILVMRGGRRSELSITLSWEEGVAKIS